VKNWRGAGSSDISSRDDLEEGSDDDTQKLCEPSQQQAEVVAGCGENGVDAVAEASRLPISKVTSEPDISFVRIFGRGLGT